MIHQGGGESPAGGEPCPLSPAPAQLPSSPPSGLRWGFRKLEGETLPEGGATTHHPSTLHPNSRGVWGALRALILFVAFCGSYQFNPKSSKTRNVINAGGTQVLPAWRGQRCLEADSIVFGKASQEVQSPDSAHFLLSSKALLGFKQSVEFYISTSLIPYHRKSSSSVLRLSWGSRILHGKGQGFMSCNSGVTLGK